MPYEILYRLENEVKFTRTGAVHNGEADNKSFKRVTLFLMLPPNAEEVTCLVYNIHTFLFLNTLLSSTQYILSVT
jgi:hypothetical protein